jgi:hypothetical protein
MHRGTEVKTEVQKVGWSEGRRDSAPLKNITKPCETDDWIVK